VVISLTVPDPFVNAALANTPAKNRGKTSPVKFVANAEGRMRMRNKL
jgi:hypothetical protein